MLLALAIAVVSVVNSNSCQARQSSELQSAKPSWFTLADQVDCEIENGSWKQARYEDSQSQKAYEQIEFVAGKGNQLMIARPVSPSFVIPELKAAVRVRSQRRGVQLHACLLYTSPSPRDRTRSRMPSSA